MRQGVFLLVALILIAGCAAAESKIHSMVAGDKCLELLENRQLTSRLDGPLAGVWVSPNGSFVACFFSPDDDETEDVQLRAKMVLVPTSGSRAVTLMSCPKDEPEQVSLGYEQWCPGYCSNGNVSWSPNSRLIAFPAVHITCKGKETDGSPIIVEQECVVVVNTTGARQSVFTIGGGESPDCIVWSPDSEKLACVTSAATVPASGEDEIVSTSKIHILDTATGSIQTICTERNRWINLLEWQTNDKGLLTVESVEERHELCERPLDGKPVRVISEGYDPFRSPSGAYRLLRESESGMDFEQCTTGETTKTVKTTPDFFAGWAPGKELFAFTRGHELSDDNGMRDDSLYQLWIACVQDHKLNHMCIALDVEQNSDIQLSWSKDCTKLAYVSQGHAFLADLAWREPEPVEKALAGLPLSEEEEKQVLLENAGRIVDACHDYSVEHDGEFPPAGTFRQDIASFLEDPDVMLKPGTDQVIVKYIQPSLDQLESGEDVVVLVLDAGYDWLLEVHPDGHSKLVKKQ